MMKMTDRELLELIAKQVGTLSDQVNSNTKEVEFVSAQVGTLTRDVTELKKGQEDTNNHLKSIDNHLDSLETKADEINEQLQYTESINANRHIEIIDKVNYLQKDLTVVEAVAGKNMMDIAHIKAVK